jgi:hypothetical protein
VADNHQTKSCWEEQREDRRGGRQAFCLGAETGPPTWGESRFRQGVPRIEGWVSVLLAEWNIVGVQETDDVLAA